MASIKYLLQSKKTSAPIYARLSLGRNLVFKRKTGLYINPHKWSNQTGFPKGKDEDSKVIKNDLKELELYVLNRLNQDNSKGVKINGNWLQRIIDLYFERISENTEKSDNLLDAVQDYIDNAGLRRNSKGGTGLSKSRIQGISRLKSLLAEYLGHKEVKVSEVNVSFANKFSSWMHIKRNYAKSYTLKMVDNLKTVCKDAELHGIRTNSQLNNIKGGKIKNEKIIYLSHEEQEKILNTDLDSHALENARKWLILGCNIGQRGGDLLKLSEDNLTTKEGVSVIELTQQKTGKHIYIPINETVKEIIGTGFPKPISMQKFNKHIKIICKEAGLNEIISTTKICLSKESEKSNIRIKRKVQGDYEKWELITSHVCRRSFATNLHGHMPLPYIMNITGHTTEKTYLNYIGKTSADYVSQIAYYFDKQDKKRKKEADFKIIRNQVANSI
jgi:integrase